MENQEKRPRRNRKEKKKWSTKKKIGVGVGAFLALVLIIVGSMYWYFRANFYQATGDITVEDGEKGPDLREVDGITNVLLIGTDGRTLEESSRSDSMIIASIDANNKNVKLASIMRDTLVDIPGHGQQKINAAYALGGIDLLLKTISQNFNIKLDKYVAVNFWGFEAIIDEIGGLQIDVKDYEIDEVNKYIGEATGLKSPLLDKPGLQMLNGQQALSYARIRKVGNGAYERDERQREVLFKVAEKLKDVSVLKWPGLANSLSGQVKTNIDIPQALNLAYTIMKMPTLDFKQMQIPQNELSWGGLYKNKGWVLLIDKEQNAKVLEEFIFENKEPDSKNFNIKSWQTKLANLKEEEKTYNKENGINPEEHANEDKAENEKPDPKPEDVKPEPEPEVETIDVTKYLSVGMDIVAAKNKLDAAGIKYNVSGNGTVVASFTKTIKKGETVNITVKEKEKEKKNVNEIIRSGMTIGEAKAALANAGFKVNTQGAKDSDILESFSPGGLQEVGSTITLTAKKEVAEGNTPPTPGQ